MGKLFKWTKKHIPNLIFSLIFAVIAPFSFSFVPMFTKYIFNVALGYEGGDSKINLPKFLLDYFDKFDGLKAILVVGLALLLYQVLRGFILFCNGYLRGKLAESIAFDIRSQMYFKIQNFSYLKQKNMQTGDLIQRCTSDVETVSSFVSSQVTELIRIASLIIFSAWQMSRISLELTLVTLVISPVMLVISIIFFRHVKKIFTNIEEREAEMTTKIQENVNGVRVVKAFNQELNEIEEFDQKNKAFRDTSYKLGQSSALYWGATDFLAMLQYGATMIVAIYLAKANQLSTSDIITALMYIGTLIFPIRGLGRVISEFGKTIVSANRIEEIVQEESEYEINGTLKPEITGAIEFKDVHLAFPDSKEHLLKGVSFKINPGETVALVGKTGSGKSTIANLLVRFLETSKGEILIDGVSVKDIEKHWLRSNIGLILQDPFLYTGTVYENINIGNRNPEIKVITAANVAAIHGDIASFDKGYYTLVGEKGVTLSGGQKQRISIARMLLLERPVLIFDDSLSAVDTKTDFKIRQALKEANPDLTSIIITHRITTARQADKIIVLDEGVVSNIGTHEELVKKDPLYKSLWDIQGDLEETFNKYVEEAVA
ncbi:MAG TPA: ABC transporter ATP-binding protein [Acholeplasma sp.]|jgi:ATP-binding cassette subfamily B protein|nr:ABC transporter ATP-binding protein [Acholeplasma sp.]